MRAAPSERVRYASKQEGITAERPHPIANHNFIPHKRLVETEVCVIKVLVPQKYLFTHVMPLTTVLVISDKVYADKDQTELNTFQVGNENFTGCQMLENFANCKNPDHVDNLTWRPITCPTCFFKYILCGPLLPLFQLCPLILNIKTIFQQINLKNDPSSMRHRDSNSLPPGNESPPITTRPVANLINILCV